MDPHRVYKASKMLREVEKDTGDTGLKSFHTYRYSYFVDSSSRGFECTYARKTLEYVDKEVEELKEYLKLGGFDDAFISRLIGWLRC